MKYIDFLKTMNKCPFCSPEQNHIIDENNSCLLIISLAPYHDHHVLIVPKKHYMSVLELSQSENADINAMQREAIKLLNKLGHENISLLIREGRGGSKSVEHMHYHVIPDVSVGCSEHSGPNREVLEESKRLEICTELKSALSSIRK